MSRSLATASSAPFGLRQHRHALGDAVNGPLRDLGPLPPPDQRVGLELRPQRLGLLESLRDFFEDFPVGASDEYADLLQRRQIVGDGLEPAYEEVADGDVGPRRTRQHLPQPLQQRGIGRCVEDVHVSAMAEVALRGRLVLLRKKLFSMRFDFGTGFFNPLSAPLGLDVIVPE